jgi:NIPSNAP
LIQRLLRQRNEEIEDSMTLNRGKFRSWESKDWRFKGMTVCGIALGFFAAGSLITARLMQVNQVRADSNRVFELRVYHALPGKLPVLESRFRDKTSRTLARHNLNIVGCWVTQDAGASENSFIWIVAHQSREEANKNWEAFEVDPEFQEILKSEQTEKTVEKVDVTYMRPTDFSPMK